MMPQGDVKNPFALGSSVDDEATAIPKIVTAPPATEKPALVVADLVEKSVEETLGKEVEEDGDVFWVIQRFVWGIVKSIVIIGGLGLIFWFVWGDGEFALPDLGWKEAAQEQVEKVKVRPKKSAENSTQSEINPTYYEGIQAVRWNFWLYQNYRASISDPLESGVLWLRDTEDLFVVPLPAQIPAQNPVYRQQQLNQLVAKIDELLARDQKIRGFLVQEMQALGQQSVELDQIEAAYEAEIVARFEARRGEELSGELIQKISAGNQKYGIDNQLWVRELIVQKMMDYAGYLQRVKTIILTNERAIVQNIQIVNFPDDPFGSIVVE